MNITFFFQAEDGIRDIGVTGVQTCALPIFALELDGGALRLQRARRGGGGGAARGRPRGSAGAGRRRHAPHRLVQPEDGRAAWWERGVISGGAVAFKKKYTRSKRYEQIPTTP